MEDANGQADGQIVAHTCTHAHTSQHGLDGFLAAGCCCWTHVRWLCCVRRLLLLSSFPKVVANAEHQLPPLEAESVITTHDDETEEGEGDATSTARTVSHTHSAPLAVLCCAVRLRVLLSTSSGQHTSRDSATRGLRLDHTNAIVHQMAPAGLTANRSKPQDKFVPSAQP